MRAVLKLLHLIYNNIIRAQCYTLFLQIVWSSVHSQNCHCTNYKFLFVFVCPVGRSLLCGSVSALWKFSGTKNHTIVELYCPLITLTGMQGGSLGRALPPIHLETCIQTQEFLRGSFHFFVALDWEDFWMQVTSSLLSRAFVLTSDCTTHIDSS